MRAADLAASGCPGVTALRGSVGAARACRRALEHDPSCVAALALLDALCEELGDAQGQLDALTARIALESDDRLLEAMHWRQADVLERLGRRADAEQARRRARVALDGDFVEEVPGWDAWGEEEGPQGDPPSAASVLGWFVGLVLLGIVVMLLVR